jgi:hypothetical protein
MKAYISMLADKVLYGLCTVGDYLVFGGARLLRYRSPEPETLIRAPNFAEGSADVTHTAAVVAWAEPDDFPVQSQNAIEEQMLNVSCPTRMHMWGNAYNPDTGIYGVQAIPDQFHDDKWLF